MTPTELIEQVECARSKAANRPRARKEHLGQFLTSHHVAGLITSAFRPTSQAAVRLLDPGAGVGSLTAAFVTWLVQQDHRPETLEIIGVELDETLMPFLTDTLTRCRDFAENFGIRTTVEARYADFLRLCGDETQLFSSSGVLRDFTHVIMNPPYHKINADSRERLLLREHGIEVSNIYAGFVALATKLLAYGGELAAITPRSFCNGVYFKDFRRRFFTSMKLETAYVLVSRQAAFSDDDVLQENVIFSARKTVEQPQFVTISAIDGISRTEHRVPYSTVLPPNDGDFVIHLPADSSGIHAMDAIAKLPATLEDLGLTVSTGPVVDFRSKAFLLEDALGDSIPLLYPTHFSSEGIEWPKPGKKPNALLNDPGIAPALVRGGNYVLTKRFSSKEEKKRITARVLESDRFPHSFIGLENHLNYFHARGHGLDADLCFGLAAYLNATLVDTYFRQFNGHTQVNASDLRMMRYPAADDLHHLGTEVRLLGKEKYDQQRTDDLVERLVFTHPPA